MSLCLWLDSSSQYSVPDLSPHFYTLSNQESHLNPALKDIATYATSSCRTMEPSDPAIEIL